MSDPRAAIRPAVFRAVGPTQEAPSWMVRTHEPVVAAAFPRHGTRLEAAPPIDDEVPEPSDTHVVSSSDVVPSIAPPPRLASVPPPPRIPSMPAPAVGPSPALTRALEALAVAREEALVQAREEMVALAVDVARVLVDAELELRPELHQNLVKAGLEMLGPGVTPRVRVSAEAFDAMVASLGGRTFESAGRRLEIELDPSLSGAGAVLEAGDARVDGTIDARVQALRAALVRLVSEERKAAA